MEHERGAVESLLAKVELVTSLYFESFNANNAMRRLFDRHPEIGVYFYGEKPQHPSSRERELLKEAHEHSMVGSATGNRLIPAIQVALDSITRDVVQALADAEVVPVPVQWAIGLRQKLEALGTIAVWNWDHDQYTVQERYISGVEILRAVNPVKQWLSIGAPGIRSKLVNAPSSASLITDPGLKRLHWLLSRVIGILETTKPEHCLGALASWEDEIAEFIESTGLADERGLPSNARPVFHRRETACDEDGCPTRVVFSYATVDGHFSKATFDWWYASAGPEMQGKENEVGWSDVWQRKVASDQIPNPRFVDGLLGALRGWRDYVEAPRKLQVTQTPSIEPKARRLTSAEKALREKAVADYIRQKREQGCDVDDQRLSRDAIVAATTVPASFVSKTTAWRALAKEREQVKRPPPATTDPDRDPLKGKGSAVEAHDHELDRAIENGDWSKVQRLQQKQQERRR